MVFRSSAPYLNAGDTSAAEAWEGEHRHDFPTASQSPLLWGAAESTGDAVQAGQLLGAFLNATTIDVFLWLESK